MIFRCAKCMVPITGEVVLAEESMLTEYAAGMVGEDYVPQGYYSVGVPFRHEPEIYSQMDSHYVINLKDLINTKQHSNPDRLGGCCGLSGMSGFNTMCVHDHELGVECSDCWQGFHYIHIPPGNVAPVEC